MADLPRRPLGRTGLEVTTLGYGAMELRDRTPEQAAALLNEVLDLGINFIDTSIDYGRSEELSGATIPHRRDEYVLASKCGVYPVRRRVRITCTPRRTSAPVSSTACAR